jgi:GT2 family glycosyltransferase
MYFSFFLPVRNSIQLRLSVVIVNYNVKYFLEQCLYSVFKALRDIPSEVFVVDNNSVDGSVALIREKFPQVRLIQNTENTGFSSANNQALRLASGEYVLLLNPDTVVQEDTFQRMLQFMDAHPDAGAAGIKMLDGKGNFLPESKRGLPTPMVAFYKIFGLSKLFPNSKRFGHYHLSYLDKNSTHPVDVLSGAFMFIRKSALDKAGLLDEDFFMYGEDIDLSYRLTKAGYRNYYFAGSSIIHYKGESTKKGSVNYVRMFYRAMAVFARKHFSRARLFIFFIYAAISARAAAAVAFRVISRLFFPAIDFILILSGLYLCKTVYEIKFKLYPNFYSADILRIFFPLYTLIWMTFVYFSGGYDRPLKLRALVRGMLAGSGFILIVYSLLPEYYRFSRALILIGSVYALAVYLLTRWIYHAIGLNRFRLGGHQARARIGVIGAKDEFDRVSALLDQAEVKPAFVGFISYGNGAASEQHIGSVGQVDEVIRVYQLDEIIFCARDVSSAEIIDKMIALTTSGVDFRIAPPESLSIIGSSSIDTAGELYMIDVNNVGKPANRRNKRLLDVLVSCALLLSSWVLVWFQDRPGGFFRNIFRVLMGKRSWVGYGKRPRRDLPAIRPSVLTAADLLREGAGEDRRNLALLNYSKNYRTENDIRIILKRWRKLGN